MTGPWWQSAVLYQIYPRSFADSDGDGNGDLPGIVEHLDHLDDLGVDGIWLSPVTISPNADWGYDVADFCAVQPDFGSMADLDRLLSEAGRRGIRVLMDLVPNHTSDRHPWFLDARSSRGARRREWYVWADPGPDGGPPNNWVSTFGGPAWTLDERTGQHYLHNHLAEQPDLNWWNDEVRRAFDDIIRFWLDKGVAGFRIDVCNGIVKDARLRDNPPAEPDDDLEAQLFGQRSVYNLNRPEVHDILRHWRELSDGYPGDRVLIGETPLPLEALPPYYGEGDELHMAFNFPFITTAFRAETLRRVVARTEELLPDGAWPAWTGSNHDLGRLSSRWCEGHPDRIRLALVMLLCLRGTPVLYQGDEIGLGDVEVPPELMRDPLGVRYWPAYAGRDAGRTPLPWRNSPGAGFTTPDARPWLPLGDPSRCNVEEQRGDPRSVLSLVRDVIGLRRRTPDLGWGSHHPLPSPDDTWVWRRGRHHLVALNLSDRTVDLRGLAQDLGLDDGLQDGPDDGLQDGPDDGVHDGPDDGHRVAEAPAQGHLTPVVVLSTDRAGEGRPFGGRLGPWQGAVLRTGQADRQPGR